MNKNDNIKRDVSLLFITLIGLCHTFTSTRCNYHGFLPDACIALRIAPPKTRLQQHYDT